LMERQLSKEEQEELNRRSQAMDNDTSDLRFLLCNFNWFSVTFKTFFCCLTNGLCKLALLLVHFIFSDTEESLDRSAWRLAISVPEL